MTHHTLCFKEIWVTPKIRILPFGTLSKMLDLENFVTAGRSSLGAVNRSIKTGDDRLCLLRLRLSTPWTVASTTNSRSTLCAASRVSTSSVVIHSACQFTRPCAVHLRQLILTCVVQVLQSVCCVCVGMCSHNTC